MLIALLSVVACTAPPVEAPPAPAPAPAPAPTPAPAPEPADEEDEDGPAPKEFRGTIGVTDEAYDGGAGSPVPLVRNLRARARDGFDRVVFEFEGAVPGYHLEYVDKPVRDCGSGDPVPVAGDAWLEVRMTPANAHTEEGKPTLPFREKPLELGVARELQQTCDFEATVTWVIGVASPGAYRVIERTDPPRLVIDVQVK